MPQSSKETSHLVSMQSKPYSQRLLIAVSLVDLTPHAQNVNHGLEAVMHSMARASLFTAPGSFLVMPQYKIVLHVPSMLPNPHPMSFPTRRLLGSSGVLRSF
jgi:hypothetical protein